MLVECHEIIFLNLKSLFVKSGNPKLAVYGVNIGNTKLF